MVRAVAAEDAPDIARRPDSLNQSKKYSSSVRPRVTGVLLRVPDWLDYSDPRGSYVFPDLESRGFKLAFDRHGPEADPDTQGARGGPESLAEARELVRERFPGLASAPVLETRVCQYENTANSDFVIDRHPNFENIWVVGGGSGHGFKHGPAVGEYVERLLAGAVASEPRFALNGSPNAPG